MGENLGKFNQNNGKSGEIVLLKRREKRKCRRKRES